MNSITGQQLDRLPYENIRKVADLTYYDGPLLSLFRDFEGENYIFHWCDSDEICNRWLAFQIADQQLKGYIKQGLTLAEMIRNPVDGKIFVVDIDGQGKHISVLLTQSINLPSDYLPCEDTYFDPSVSYFYEQEICSESFAILFDEIRELRQALALTSVTQNKITFNVLVEPLLQNA